MTTETSMTVDQMRARLGLVSHAEHEYNCFLRLREKSAFLTTDEAIRQRYRGTGRTTEMILHALEVSQRPGEVIVFVAPTQRMAAQIALKAAAWARELGMRTHFGSRASTLPAFSATDFYDHTCVSSD